MPIGISSVQGRMAWVYLQGAGSRLDKLKQSLQSASVSEGHGGPEKGLLRRDMAKKCGPGERNVTETAVFSPLKVEGSTGPLEGDDHLTSPADRL